MSTKKKFKVKKRKTIKKKHKQYAFFLSPSFKKKKSIKYLLSETPKQIQKGLMWRRQKLGNKGMVFIFHDKPKHRHFHMRNTFIPLDIIFANSYGKIHHIHSNAKPHDKTNIHSKYPTSIAFEVDGNWTKKNNIQIGDYISF